MDKYVIYGKNKLEGEITISGAKNAALPIMAASLLTSEKITLENVPNLVDIHTMKQLLEILGKKVLFENNFVIIEEINNTSFEAPYDIVRKMRASIAVMGPLLARRKQCKVSFPGGCAIGPRPIDLHIKGFKSLGTEILIEHGYIYGKADKLLGKRINLTGINGPSVLGTENIMMAATLAEGVTIIEGAACEPEVVDLANFLCTLGAKISGAGTPVITIEGVPYLHGGNYKIIPDRIEAGTFIVFSGITGGKIHIKNLNINHIEIPITLFSKAGIEIEIISESEIIAKGYDIKPVEVETFPYPFFPTDLQAQLMALVSLSDGISLIKENIFPDRFLHAPELARMGADIRIEGPMAIIKGVRKLSGASVMVSDLRAGAGLVAGALAAEGKSEILRIYHIDRGYENFEEKLSNIGANIVRVPQ